MPTSPPKAHAKASTRAPRVRAPRPATEVLADLGYTAKPDARLLDRELAQLAFNARVLNLANDPRIPLLERLRYLCIVSSNLDEFFEIRVSGLMESIRAEPRSKQAIADRAALVRVADMAQRLVKAQYALYNEVMIPALAAENIAVLHHADRNPAQRAWVSEYFFREVQPLLTPIGLDPAHPFPQVVNKSLNFIVQLSGKDAFGRSSGIAIVKAPRVLPRVIAMPKDLSDGKTAFVLLSSVMRAHLADIFPGRDVVGYSQFRVTRDSDLWVDEEDVKNLKQALALELSHRNFGHGVRLEVAAGCPDHLARFLLEQFELTPDALYRVDGPVNLVRLTQMLDVLDRPDLRFPPMRPALPRYFVDGHNVFEAIAKGDILLHHPFQSFDPVVDFLRTAARDPKVVAIKQTVYRTGVNSVLMETLIEAARNGKEVTVVVELKARFDEEANINWAARLEQVGAQVVYGMVGLKTHAKLALVLRREEKGLRHYAHLGTGNYHPTTARLYTDFGIMTANRSICNDVAQVFIHLTSMGKVNKLEHLLLAPFTLAKTLLKLIEREADLARAGKPARIVAKMNALLDDSIIEALYAASSAGVKVDLIVRGACALRPGVLGMSEHIRVRSIVGRFLEHTRVFAFGHKNPDIYLSSADWMGRNLFRRIEVAWPVLDADHRRRIFDEGLAPYLADNVDAWELTSDGSYRRPTVRGEPQAAQAWLVNHVAEGL
jgi:polyphosphate kinase